VTIVPHDIAKRLVCKPALRPVLDCKNESWIDYISHIHNKREAYRRVIYYDMRHDDRHVWATYLVFHRHDLTHQGDTESIILVFPRSDDDKMLHHSPFALFALTRAHNIWHIYESPRQFGGRYHALIGSGKHPITLRTKEDQGHNGLRLMYYDYDMIDMNSPVFVSHRPLYGTWFDRWGVDWPEDMTDQRVKDGAKYPHSPVIDPMLFIEKARGKRCGVKFE